MSAAELLSMTAPGPARRACWPNEPRFDLTPQQVALTERYLLPDLPALEAFLLALRLQVDGPLRHAQPVKLGKPYPLGQCLEISLAMQHALRSPDASALPEQAQAGAQAYQAFRRAGGELRQVWGDLRGQFFQNAFQLGTLYVDVSNDTVTITKPKIEILPFAQAQLTPIRDFAHFGQIAQRYWKGRIYPNHVLPELAPYLPLVYEAPDGVLGLRDPSRYMLRLTMASGFAPSADALEAPPMPQALFERMASAFAGLGERVAGSPAEGRALALSACRTYRARRLHLQAGQTSHWLARGHRVNAVLGQLPQQPLNHTPVPAGQPLPAAGGLTMTRMNIDGTTYEVDQLPEEAKAAARQLMEIEQAVARLKAEAQALQAVRVEQIERLREALKG